MEAIGRATISICIYWIELDFHLREIAKKELQDAIDSAGNEWTS